MRQDSLRTAVSGGKNFECLQVKQTRLLTHSSASAVDNTGRNRFTISMAGVGRGRRDCMRGDALSSLLIKPTHRMARPPCRHMHRAGAWINPHKPRQGSQCSSCHSTCLVFRAHSLGGCCQQLAVTASGWWMVYYTASITLIHSSEGKPPARCPHACWGAAAAGQQTRRRLGGRGGAC